MKIEKLIIYGFGKHENLTIELTSGINVVYGLNEAGKTTIQQFILHVLFGFPQRNSAFLRYEPKSGGKYGGQVQLIDKVYGRCTVERIRGKSAGDVTIHFEDGTRGGEEELKELLRHYNRTSFESIFSFSLFQLQGFEKMDEEELSRTLLASGTTGVDSLLQLEKRMEVEMGDLFKKSGRVPRMNVKIKELRELELELKEVQKQAAEYAPSIERIHKIEEQLLSLREQENSTREHIEKLSLLRQLLPLQQKRGSLESRLAQFGTTNFPSDGIRRFESISSQLVESKATKRRVEEELAELKTRMPTPHEADRITTIELLLAKESEWHGWHASITTLDNEIRRLSSLKERIYDRLGVTEEEGKRELFEADVSIRKEEEMHELLNKMTGLNNEIGIIENQFSQLENEIVEARTKLELLNAPTIEEIERAREYPTLRQKLAEAKAYVAFGNRGAERNTQFVPILLFILALAFIGFGFLQQQWFSVALGVIVGGIGLYFNAKKNTEDNPKLSDMERFVSEYDGKEEEMELLITRIATYRSEKNRQEEVIKALELNYETIEATLDNLHIQRRQKESSFEQFMHNYGFDGLPSPGIVPELFRMIRELQEIERDMVDVVKRKRILETKLDVRAKEVEKVLQHAASPALLYELLRKEFIRLKEETEKIKSLTARIEQLKPVLKEAALLVNSLEENLRILLSEAGAETEEDFYSTYDIHQETTRLKAQIADIETQITASGPQEILENTTENELLTKISDCEKELSAIAETSTTLINEKASLVNKTERLLSDETYGRKLQLFEIKKAELDQLAKKWSARQAVAEAISRTMIELKETKLPEVLHHAERMFNELTGGKYEALVVTDAGSFEAVAMNGMRYPIVELSQATKEQAYISLRLALAASVLDTAPFPIIMDDPFVHFDEERLSRMIKLLETSHQHQFIYFTCHQTMKENWVEGTIINVSEIGSEQGAGVR